MNISRIAFTMGATALVVWMSGCAAKTATDSSRADSVTAHYTGRFGTASKWCGAGQIVAYASCSAEGGDVSDNHALEPVDGKGHGWTCTVHPTNTTAGADLTLTLDCATQ